MEGDNLEDLVHNKFLDFLEKVKIKTNFWENLMMNGSSPYVFAIFWWFSRKGLGFRDLALYS